MTRPLDIEDWHKRFLIQAAWTTELRSFLYTQLSINQCARILEVGCGTGVLTSELHEKYSFNSFGIDLDFSRLSFALKQDPNSHYTTSDVYELPFSNMSFDFVISHYFFLWIKDPYQACREISRVLKPGGFLLALAEPDYKGRIDSPGEMEELGRLQTLSLVSQGINPCAGRELPYIFHRSGFADVQYGMSGFQNQLSQYPEWFESEWTIIQNDLELLIPKEKIDFYKTRDEQYRQDFSRICWLPTFYVTGRKT